MRKQALLALLARAPIAALGLMIAVSSLQASCSDGGPDIANDDEPSTAADAAADAPGGDALPDAPSEDSPEDRADGMSYGDAYLP